MWSITSGVRNCRREGFMPGHAGGDSWGCRPQPQVPAEVWPLSSVPPWGPGDSQQPETVQEDLSPLHWLPVYPFKGSTNTRLWESRYLQGPLCCTWNLLDLKEIRGRKLNHSSTGWSILIQEFWRLCCDTKMLRREILTNKSESKKARGPCVRCSSPCNVRAGSWGWKAVLEWLCRGVLSLLSFQFQFVKLPLVS